jgi:hypothetical protein
MQRLQTAALVVIEPTMAPEREVETFLRTVARLQATLGAEGAKPPAGIDVEALWTRWRPNADQPLAAFSSRELRALCWNRRAVSDARFLSALESAAYIPAKLGFVRGLWHVHQHHWRLPTASSLEALFVRAGAQGGHHPKWLRAALELPALFTPGAPEAIGRKLFGELSNARQVLETIGLTTDGALAQQSLAACREQWFDLMERFVPEEAERGKHLLSAGLYGLLSSAMVDTNHFRRSVERLLRLVSRGGARYRSTLAHWIGNDRRLGHPRRRATSANWAGFSEEAKLTALRLFAAKDIGRFFDILIGKLSDHQERQTFWERYIDSPQFVDYAIACDPTDRQRLVAAWQDGQPEIARLDDAPEAHSAFIMRFRTRTNDLTIVEMSKANNAMYLFNTETFEQSVGSLVRARFAFKALKNKYHSVDWWAHSGHWESRFTEKLRGYGITGAHR